MDLLTRIQRIHVQLVGEKVQAELGTFLDEILEDVADFHDWLCLLDYADLPIVANTPTYTISGNQDDLAKVLMVLPVESDLLDPYEKCSRERFYKTILNQQSQSPGWWIPLKRANAFSLEIRIYPTPTETVTGKYFYKVIPQRADIDRFANKNVFIYGTLAKWYGRQKESEALAQRYWELYLLSRETMKQNDEIEVYPESRLRLSESTLHFYQRVRNRPKR